MLSESTKFEMRLSLEEKLASALVLSPKLSNNYCHQKNKAINGQCQCESSSPHEVLL